VKIKMISAALTEAKSPYWRSIKYSLFPPLGLATLAGYLSDEDDVVIQDEHAETLDLSDEPDLVVIQVYITSAYRAYAIADHYRSKGAHVALGGIHVTSLPDEAARHADSIFLGPAEYTWPAFLRDFRAGRPAPVYCSQVRDLANQPPVRRDLIKRHLYLVPNSVVVSRGCPHSCDFCYKESFYQGGKSFYTQAVDRAIAEIDRLPGRHLYFLDDNLFADQQFAESLLAGMNGMGRLWQAAGTVKSVFAPGLMQKAAESGLRSLFIGFETLNRTSLAEQGKHHNLGHDYSAAICRLKDLGIMVNGSFVFGMDGDDEAAPRRTVEWAVEQGIETATFHILTPYPGTALNRRLTEERRITSTNWDLYDTRHVVYSPIGVAAERLQEEYQRAYRDFYRWSSILKSAGTEAGWRRRLRHAAYTGGWKKMEWLWDIVVRAGQVSRFQPLLEKTLAGDSAKSAVEIGGSVPSGYAPAPP
jgi:radical SAM superfamily enzyme YgiQ (UPF0313 family)